MRLCVCAEFCPRIIDAAPGATVIVIGTLYKDMALKPSVLDEFDAEVCVSVKIMVQKRWSLRILWCTLTRCSAKSKRRPLAPTTAPPAISWLWRMTQVASHCVASRDWWGTSCQVRDSLPLGFGAHHAEI